MKRKAQRRPAAPAAADLPVEERLHSQTKVLVEDVALWRLIAAEKSLPYGWIEAVAIARGVTPSSVTMAIGGQTWSDMTDPPPVAANERWSPRVSHQTRPLCPTCKRRKYERRDCRDAFHKVDHRTTRHQEAAARTPRGRA